MNPRTITVDNATAGSKAVAETKMDGELWRCTRLRQAKHLNNMVERDDCNVKRLACPGLGFGNFRRGRRTPAGYETMAKIRKGPVRHVDGSDIRAQLEVIAGPLKPAA